MLKVLKKIQSNRITILLVNRQIFNTYIIRALRITKEINLYL